MCVCVQTQTQTEICISLFIWIINLLRYLQFQSSTMKLFSAFFLLIFVIPFCNSEKLGSHFLWFIYVLKLSVCNQSDIMAPASPLHGYLSPSALAWLSHTRLPPHMDVQPTICGLQNPTFLFLLHWWRGRHS